ncbi:MAG: hypothetical protein RTV41_10375 [Candidatus Thorarchaeota archaeon]
MRDRRESLVKEPEVTPSILANIPDTLRTALSEAIKRNPSGRKSILVSSNSLANRFILERWGIRPSQRRRYKNLFASVRKQCRVVFQHNLARGRVEWDTDQEKLVFGIFKFDEIRGNLILGFVSVSPESEWTLR